ncbi:MAG: transcription elongation factor Spt5 [Candidatus Pacearchaeota archaeon]
MAIGIEDEFEYLDDENSETAEDDFAPKIKGSKKALLPEESAEELNKEEEEIEKKTEEKLPSIIFNSSIFVVKVTTNKEEKALELISDKVRKKGINIYAIARPHGLRGYIFLESPDREHAEEAVFNLPYVKGIIGKTLRYDEVKSMLEPVAADIKIEKNDIVEIISEPFKNEKAKVIRVDKIKGDCVVSLLGAAVPIPVTVKLDNLRVIRREEEE